MEPKLKLEQRLTIDPKGVMSSFCWAYANNLLQKLKELDNTDRLFQNGGNKALHDENNENLGSNITNIGASVTSALADQIGYNEQINQYSALPSRISNLIECAKEFLNIFVEQNNEATVPSESFEECVNFVQSFLHDPPMLTEREAARQLVLALQTRFGIIPIISK